jgi:transposase
MRPTGDIAVYLHRQPVDFRKAINGLSLIVQDELELDPFSEALFVFLNRARNRVKLLYWERNGFCLWQKRLEKNRFARPSLGDSDTLTLTTQELNWLLDGFDIWRTPPHQQLFFDSAG